MAKKIIIAGGGTGGHIFPAIAIANAIKREQPDCDILFIGAKGKMEMERVPQAGYEIRGIDIAGFNRSSLLKNVGLPLKLVKSFFQVRNLFINYMPDADIIVYTPAIPSTHKELAFLRYNNYTLLKRSEVLGIITEASFNICIAGTHGKTTISSMVAHLLRDSGYGCNAFLGGIAVNYNSNYWSNERNVCFKALQIKSPQLSATYSRFTPGSNDVKNIFFINKPVPIV